VKPFYPNETYKFALMLRWYCVLFLVVLCSIALCQVNLEDSVVKADIFRVELGLGIPAGDIADRFGLHQSAGVGYQHKTNNNVLIGLSGAYIFGNTVKDTSIALLFNEAGSITGTDGYYFSPLLYEQGFDFHAAIGKITNIFSVNPNSGLTFLAGVGYLQHNIFIYVDELYVPQLDKAYRKGYDRFTNGFALNQYIGYYLFSNKHFVNFRAGFEFTEAFTKNRRYNFDTQSTDDTSHFDALITFKVGWNLPVFEKTQRRYYY
jgi:hypothetical protein